MATAAAIPRPMLARSGPIPTRGSWAYEVKWDGLRAIIATDRGFRVLSRRGFGYRRRSLIGEPYRERRRILERIDFRGRAHVPEIFGDGHALFDAVCEQELEGVVAKRLNEQYRPGERAWVKTKNRDYWRWEIEREGARKIRRPRQFA